LLKERNPFTFDAHLAGMEIPKEKIDDIIKMDFYKEEERKTILESGISGFCTIRDFDGVELFSKTKSMKETKSFLI
jgi:hypothetical protein